MLDSSGGATVARVERLGDKFSVRRYNAYSPKMLAGIGALADTLRDRCVIIPMKRKRPTNRLAARFNVRRLGLMLAALRDRCHLFALTHATDIAELYATAEQFPLPRELDDRARDILEPLFAVAGLIDSFEAAATVTEGMIEAARDIACTRRKGDADADAIAAAVKALSTLFVDSAEVEDLASRYLQEADRAEEQEDNDQSDKEAEDVAAL
jgi:hypothetical protein